MKAIDYSIGEYVYIKIDFNHQQVKDFVKWRIENKIFPLKDSEWTTSYRASFKKHHIPKIEAYLKTIPFIPPKWYEPGYDEWKRKQNK